MRRCLETSDSRVGHYLALGLSIAIAASCSNDAGPRLFGPDEVTLDKPDGRGGGPGHPPAAEPHVDASFDGGLTIADDGLGPYVHGVCGVVGRIWDGGTEDVTVTPAAEWDTGTGCPERHLVVDLTHVDEGEDLGTDELHHVAIISLNVAAVNDGQWHEVPAQFLGGVCERLRFDSGVTPWTKVSSGVPWTSNDVRAMRIGHPTDPAKRAWRVETLPPDANGPRDTALCLNRDRGNKSRLDGTFHVQFAVTIVER